MKFNALIRKEQQRDRRKRKREVNKRFRKGQQVGSGKAGFKKVTTYFDSVS